ncbi:dihydrofolate reductase family protein [Halalkalibacterium halodurans]|uniref:dihydrofolate reductase family protein n=1 Tax=Halalkalibacterium halodurans TaxID=86665 RepID=UPI002E1CB3F1|nr:dihydrofolate reductase family protein [Halalkalibacterium halodurans]MED4079832.1 dihydrofolate reductase family protein [Halalkalibacterium halodurans]MED4083742.1 dihydrofolate reductase family protein [Halalkalibacterium halodurans]MED4106569.1 dihydrofolate reductase family protein [Halalkalibacterium halodurans]MED4109583.1 dihydrofolate reductase family protein [Halalkalibacterium halodurans]MED4123419.1 dihydrofolate reductase family protein [Halalkalibacterium halodurans]
MGELLANVSITLDGIFTGPTGEEGNMVSWAMPGIMDSTNDGLLIFQKADAILMGRATYEGFASYWPFQEGEWADAMNQTQKFVATTTNNSELTEVRWGDYDDTISLLNSDVMSKVRELKKEIKGDIIVPASASLVQSLLSANLLDELRIIIHPVILGSGERYFDHIETRQDMKLIETKLYETSGSMLMRYESVK